MTDIAVDSGRFERLLREARVTIPAEFSPIVLTAQHPDDASGNRQVHSVELTFSAAILVNLGGLPKVERFMQVRAEFSHATAHVAAKPCGGAKVTLSTESSNEAYETRIPELIGAIKQMLEHVAALEPKRDGAAADVRLEQQYFKF